MRSSARDKSTAKAVTTNADDFTQIRGVPAYMSEALHSIGILTFEDLRTAYIPWLPWQVRVAIERWRRDG